MPRKKVNYIIATLDAETDPFVYGRKVRPFVLEAYSDDPGSVSGAGFCEVFWGDNCVEQFMAWAARYPKPCMFYAHNGGKFDFHFFHEYIDNPIKVINSRIVHATIASGDPTTNHVLRDSFAILPTALKTVGKIEIDYDKMERDKREKHKKEILEYLHGDCVSLYNFVVPFVERFGTKLTIGSTAMQEIQRRHTFGTLNQEGDAYFRQYYYGGRVQCLKQGLLTGPFVAYDVNSMYPYVMRNYHHPVNGAFRILSSMPEIDLSKPPTEHIPFFIRFIGRNRNAIPRRAELELEFTDKAGEFLTCSHELYVALKYNLVEIHDVIECYQPYETIKFEKFVDDFSAEKIAAKLANDNNTYQYAKFMLNSGYGKFGQNPENFSDWIINRDYGRDMELREKGYSMADEYDSFELWRKPTLIKETSFYDVSIAASITSAARSVLLDGIQRAVNPIYCDTDSLICESFDGEIDDSKLGAWKHEFIAPNIAIAGKKLYMAYDAAKPWNWPSRKALPGVPAYDPRLPKNPIKLVSKGGTLRPQQLIDICLGNSVRFDNDAPTMSLGGKQRFITRTFRMTTKEAMSENSDDNGEIVVDDE